MKKLTYFLLYASFSTISLYGQNVFPQKLKGCSLSKFCLDCGAPQAVYDSADFLKIGDALNGKYHFNGGKGKVGFQVLIDSSGKACVLSHTDASTQSLTRDIIGYLNECKWKPALDHGKAVNSSIEVFFEVSNNRLTGYIRRVDPDEMIANMKNPGEPVIYNRQYVYKNPSLGSYTMTVWQKENSRLPNDMGTTSVIDKMDNLWIATYAGLAELKGQEITRMDNSNSPFKSSEIVHALAVDSANNKWMCANGNIYKFDNEHWEEYDSSKLGINSSYHITTTPAGEVLFCSVDGLLILKNGKRELLDNKNIGQLPSNKIFYADRDRQGRLWIGTMSGSIMIDTARQVTAFNATATPIKETCITAMTEDGEGNIYFALYAYSEKGRHREEEGFAVLSANGEWKHYTDSNSGLPSNHINALLFDRFEKVLWIATNESGLVRFDLKDGWEDYHNLNSKVPSSYVFDLSQDSKGCIYASTFYGILQLKKK